MTTGRVLIGSAVGVALVVAVGVSCVPAQSQDDGPGAGPHTLAEYDALFTELNNWGRWGEDDERGTANLVTEAKSREAAGLVTRGVSVSLSHNPMPDEAADNPDSAFEHVMADGFRVDTITFNYHGYGVSHIDALCHFVHNGMLYNGVPASASTAEGCGKHGIQNLKNGIITRGVLSGHRASQRGAVSGAGDGDLHRGHRGVVGAGGRDGGIG